MLSLKISNNKLIIKNNALLAIDPNSPSFKASIGFQAFDGSNRYFRRIGVYDLDCCFIEYPPLGLPRGRKNNPAISNPNDGYYILEKEIYCCCPTGRCVVVESVRWYGEVLPVGTIFPCPPTNRSVFVPRTYVPPPNPMPNEYVFDPANTVIGSILPSPLNTATFGVMVINPNCCNADGSKIYLQLSNEIL
jgi:hypothetical protein